MNRTFRFAACAFALALTACSDSATDENNDGDEVPDFQGTYALTGTYTGRPAPGLLGSMVVSNQTGTTATVAIALQVLDNGNVSFSLNMESEVAVASSDPVQASLAGPGAISFAFTGREEIFGIDPEDCCEFTFSMTGTLSGNTIGGDWTLTRDLPSLDSGTFTATR